MFEKEAEKYRKEKLKEQKDKFVFELPEVYIADIKQAFLDGAEFGYNKANEWHNLREDPNDLPKDNDEKLCFYGKGKVVARYDSEYDCWETEFNNLVTTFSSSILIAWKEIVFPELPKEGEWK